MQIKFQHNPECQCGRKLSQHLGNLRCDYGSSKTFANKHTQADLSKFKTIDVCGAKITFISGQKYKGSFWGEIVQNGEFLELTIDKNYFCPTFKPQHFVFQ